MPASPVTTEHLQQQIEELKRRFEEAMAQEKDFRRNFERLSGSLRDEFSVAASNRRTTPIPGVPTWLSPILQGVTVVIVIGAALWVGQITGTVNTKVNNLQKSADKINDWKDTASVSLGSLNQKVDDLKSKVDDLSKTKK